MNDTKANVLVAESDATTREFFVAALAHAGFRVDIAMDGLETIGRLEAGHYAAVVVDLHLPRTDGLGVLQFLSERQPALLGRVVLVTGLALPEIDALYAICATLPKAISASRLVETIKTCVDRHHKSENGS